MTKGRFIRRKVELQLAINRICRCGHMHEDPDKRCMWQDVRYKCPCKRYRADHREKVAPT